LTIPYFSHVTNAKDLTVASEYELDSIYGANSKLDLQIYETNFYQRDIDPATGEAQKYYSDQYAQFENQRGTFQLNNKFALPKQNTEFVFSNIGDIEPATEAGAFATKIAPRMLIELDTAFFSAKIFSPAGLTNMVNNNVFRNYMRGLHFKVAPSGGLPGNLAMMDFSQGRITITYDEYLTVPVAGQPLPARTEEKKLIIRMGGNSVNLLQYEHSATYGGILSATPNYAQGDEKLYIKGGEGSMAVIEMFKDDAELAALRAKKSEWLVNDASLTFYVENSATGMGQGDPKAVEPNRVYLYDLNNKQYLTDYFTDQSVSAGSVKYNKKFHGGIIVKQDQRGTQYKIKLTNHIRRLIDNDSVKNVRLGLVVTENINTTSNKSIKTPKVLPLSGTFAAFSIKDTPLMNIANPLGTILWGSAPSVPEDKKLKLTIFYTKPNQ